jgi:hypothetical protein
MARNQQRNNPGAASATQDNDQNTEHDGSRVILCHATLSKIWPYYGNYTLKVLLH